MMMRWVPWIMSLMMYFNTSIHMDREEREARTREEKDEEREREDIAFEECTPTCLQLSYWTEKFLTDDPFHSSRRAIHYLQRQLHSFFHQTTGQFNSINHSTLMHTYLNSLRASHLFLSSPFSCKRSNFIHYVSEERGTKSERETVGANTPLFAIEKVSREMRQRRREKTQRPLT